MIEIQIRHVSRVAAKLLVGSFAYFSAAWRTEPDLFLNIMNRENARIHGIYIRKYYNLAGCSILVQGFFGLLIVYLKNDKLLLVSLILFLCHLVLSEYFLLKTLQVRAGAGCWTPFTLSGLPKRACAVDHNAFV